MKHKRNPSGKWVLFAFVPQGTKEKRLHFDGKKFTVAGKARRFSHPRDASNFGHRLRERFPVLAKVRLRVEPLYSAASRRYLKNPSGLRSGVDSYARELDQADDLLNAFAGRSGREVLAIKHKPVKAGLVVGELLGVMYSTTRDGNRESYKHEFRKKSRPLLVSNFDGSRIDIVGGRYRFTEKGIEDA